MTENDEIKKERRQKKEHRPITIIIITIASHNEMRMIYTMTIMYMRRNATVKRVRRFKVPAKANDTSILMEV